ncbi:MAG: GPI anchored serine-threonine rich family protein [Candidatus Aminicenantes bacterium]|nr:GPI anchored serine-threonine rich family protein [Candidatus Aminicenantes bacterium]
MKSKKIIFMQIALFFLSALAFSQTIEVTSPHTGDTWYKGQTNTIAWTKTGTMDDFVKIKLRNSTSTAVELDIVTPIANNGTYSWKIPTSVAPGEYVIRVRVMEGAVYGESGVFSIANMPFVSKPKETNLHVVPRLVPQFQKKQSILDQLRCLPDLTVTNAWIEIRDSVRFIIFTIENKNWKNAKLDINLENELVVQLYALHKRAFRIGIDKTTIELLNYRGYRHFQIGWDYTEDTRIWIDFHDVVKESNEGNNIFLFDKI